MKITNIEEFEKIFNFIFSSNFKSLKNKDKTLLKEQVALAINEIDGAKQKMKTIFEDELRTIRFNNYSNEFEKDIEMFLYVYNTFSEVEKIELITKVITELNDKRDYYLQKEVIFVLLDSLPDKKKIMLLSKLDVYRLLKIMSSCNESAHEKKQKIINWFYYKYYYNICQKAMKMKELR